MFCSCKVDNKEVISKKDSRVKELNKNHLEDDNGELISIEAKGCAGFTVLGKINPDYLLIIKGEDSLAVDMEKRCNENDLGGIHVSVEKMKKGRYYSNLCSDIKKITSITPELVGVERFNLEYIISTVNGKRTFTCKVREMKLENGKTFKNIFLNKVFIHSFSG